MRRQFRRPAILWLAGLVSGLFLLTPPSFLGDIQAFYGVAQSGSGLDQKLAEALQQAGFTGNIQATLETRLGRPVDRELADLGRLIFFDNIQGLHNDNSCAGCHTPAFGFGDSQSIAIGVDNNSVVGPNRDGPRNQRRSPQVAVSAFFPKLMWNGRFASLSGDPFDNSKGFLFPPPEGTKKFPPNDPLIKHLLAAQGHIPQTELVEMAGFTGSGTIFDDGHGSTLPPDQNGDGFLNDEIRQAVLDRFNATAEYRKLFGEIYNAGRPFAKGGIQFFMIGQALAEFQISLTAANAPIDRFARGERSAMTDQQKRGGLLFFDKANCVQCHAVAGKSNEMFSDFENRVIGIPQIAPFFGVGAGNVLFDGPDQNEDFGAEQITGDSKDRYKFRTSPLRNVAVQETFSHNGAFTRLEDAVRHHLNVRESALNYDPVAAGVDADLTLRMGPIHPVLARLDPLLKNPTKLDSQEFGDLLAFVREGLLDPRAKRENLCKLVPESVPSGMKVALFEGCQKK